jgi:transcription elongation factor Elf1
MTFVSDEYFCENCKGKGDHPHMCFPAESVKKFTCEYCGAENVTHKHICKAKVEKLRFMCLNCGMLAVTDAQLCHPIAIDEPDLEKWKKIVKNPSDNLACKNCNQPVTRPGHKCDQKLPFTCEFCGKTIENYSHVCKEQMGKMKFYCKLCGRLAPSKDQLCAPFELP